jgi:ribosomal protein S27E
MTSTLASLLSHIKRWFGGAELTSLRVTRGARGQKIRSITVSCIGCPYEVVVFRHSLESWQVYPPNCERLTSAAVECTA